MKVAVTADCHLDDRGRHPERHHALEDILGKLESEGIRHLIVAGDLFDSRVQSYSGFEEVCSGHPGIRLHIIRGNHDLHLRAESLAPRNAIVYDSPEMVELGDMPFLFVPYRQGVGMGEAVAEAGGTSRDRWVLVGHGDYTRASGVGNPYESGTYMPLSSADVARLSPSLVLLGHIHAGPSFEEVHYPGSPCGMDINETGPRHFLVVDTETLAVDSREVRTDVVFLQRHFFLIPGDDALQRLRSDIARTLDRWSSMVPDLQQRARIRVTASGFTSDRKGVYELLSEGFSGLAFHDDGGPDVSGLRESLDRRRAALAARAGELVEELDWDFGGREPDRNRVMDRVLELIYGGGD
ncbi:MAG: metallophosphoesterase family protein [Candidatus Fermentibacteraceae bacterium]